MQSKTHRLMLTQEHAWWTKSRKWSFNRILKSSMTDQKQIVNFKHHQWTPSVNFVVVSIHLDLRGKRLVPPVRWRPVTSSSLTGRSHREWAGQDNGAPMCNRVSPSSTLSLCTPATRWGLRAPQAPVVVVVAMHKATNAWINFTIKTRIKFQKSVSSSHQPLDKIWPEITNRARHTCWSACFSQCNQKTNLMEETRQHIIRQQHPLFLQQVSVCFQIRFVHALCASLGASFAFSFHFFMHHAGMR